MKVLYVIPYPKFFSQHNSVGGHVTHCIGILQAFLKRGAIVRFLGEETDDVLNDLDISTSIYPQQGSGYLARHLWLLGFLRKLETSLSEFQPDIVYMRYSASAALWYPLFRRLLKDKDFILEVNSLGSQHIKYLKFFDRKMLSSASTVVSISTLLSEFISEQLGIESITVPNGIDECRIPETLVSQQILTSANNIQIVYTGLLKPNYGLEFAVNTLESIAAKYDIDFTVIGDGPLMPELQAMALQRPWLKIIGPVSFKDIPRILTEANILLYPSGRFNKFQSPTKLFEYMAAARPIVAVKTEQTQKLLGNGKYGYLFDIDDPIGLQNSIIEILSDTEKAEAKAKEARTIAIKYHSWDSRLESILKDRSVEII